MWNELSFAINQLRLRNSTSQNWNYPKHIHVLYLNFDCYAFMTWNKRFLRYLNKRIWFIFFLRIFASPLLFYKLSMTVNYFLFAQTVFGDENQKRLKWASAKNPIHQTKERKSTHVLQFSFFETVSIKRCQQYEIRVLAKRT